MKLDHWSVTNLDRVKQEVNWSADDASFVQANTPDARW